MLSPGVCDIQVGHIIVPVSIGDEGKLTEGVAVMPEEKSIGCGSLFNPLEIFTSLSVSREIGFTYIERKLALDADILPMTFHKN